MTDRDDPGFDPSEWLARQFGNDEQKDAQEEAPEPPASAPPPVVTPPVAAPPVVPPPPAGDPFRTAMPSDPPAPPSASGGGFSWGLTPGADEPVPAPSPSPEPSTLPPSAEPPLPAMPVGEPAPPMPTPPAQATPPFPPLGEPTAEPIADVPPTAAFPAGSADAPTIAFPGQAVEPAPWEPWQSRPVDEALAGTDDVIEAEIVGLDEPAGESNPTIGIDDIFGETAFRDYGEEPIVSGPPPGAPKPPRAPKGERAPLARTQKVLLWVAGSLVAALALVALFILGTRLPAALGPAPVLTASPTPTPTPSIIVIPAGPLPPGEYQWDELLGGECLLPYESAWQDRYTVVDCSTPHPAQMVARGRFEDAPGVPFPGAEELQKRINLLCTSAAVINYQVAATAIDIQVAASFPVDETDWDEGNRTYFCFVNRASGENLTASVAVPQPAVTITPTPPTPSTNAP